MHEIMHPTSGKRFEVAQNDFETQMDWNKAMIMCEELGNGWRLPTKSELELMHSELFQKGKGNLKSNYYWSNIETSSLRAWTLHFGYGTNDYGFHKNKTAYVRAVRTI